MKVLEVTKHSDGKLAKIEITDNEGTGEAQFHAWKPNKRTKETTTTSKVAIEKAPNIADVPDNVKHLVNINDVLYTVPGDGACLPNTASAFYFHDEILALNCEAI